MNGRKTKKGKNYSMNSNPDRNLGDFYQTPISMTQRFLDTDPIPDKENCTVLDPAAGKGAIIDVLIKNGFESVGGYDLFLMDPKINFIEVDTSVDYIFCNPPFSLANEFLLHSYRIARKKFFFLMPLDYLHGKQRFKKKVFRGLESVSIFIRKPMLSDGIRDDGKYNTGMLCYAWYTFNCENQNIKPTINWLDNRNDVFNLRAKPDDIDHDSQLMMEIPE